MHSLKYGNSYISMKGEDADNAQKEIDDNMRNLELIIYRAAAAQGILDDMSRNMQYSLATARDLLFVADKEARDSFDLAQEILGVKMLERNGEDAQKEVHNTRNLSHAIHNAAAVQEIMGVVQTNSQNSLVEARGILVSADAEAQSSFDEAQRLLVGDDTPKPVVKYAYQRRNKVAAGTKRESGAHSLWPLNTTRRTNMVGGKCKYFLNWNSSSRPYYLTRCKRVGPTNIESLPDELLFDILVRLPAAYLHHKARFVCRRWSHIIHSYDFVNAQNHRSTYGLLLGNKGGNHIFYNDLLANTHPILVTATQEGRIERHDIRYTCRTHFFGSSNGLVLDMEKNIHSLYISNPAINHELPLPSCSRPNCVVSRCGIGYAAASMQYKVTAPYELRSSGSYWLRCLAILTVGVDKSWRDVEIEHVHVHMPKVVARFLHWQYPLTTEGFIHWSMDNVPYVLTLDVETETVTVSRFPHYHNLNAQLTYVSTGKFLTVLVSHRDLSWEVWAMESGNGEWSKLLPDIELGGLKCRLQQFAYENDDVLTPLGWVKYPEVLALYYYGQSCTCIFYNLVTHEISSTQLPDPVYYYSASVHKNNLIRLS